MRVELRDGRLWLDGEQVDLEHDVAAAARLENGSVVVLYDYSATDKPPWATFKNLLAIDPDGRLLWAAPLPDSHADAFVAIISVEPLVAQSFSGWQCTIDPNTGDITNHEFTK